MQLNLNIQTAAVYQGSEPKSKSTAFKVSQSLQKQKNARWNLQYVESRSGGGIGGYENSNSERKERTMMEKRGSFTQPQLQINGHRATPERRFLPHIINST